MTNKITILNYNYFSLLCVTCFFYLSGSKLVSIEGLPVINLELWDVPGALDKQLEEIYFEGVDGCILVFDVANAKQSSEELAQWFDRIQAFEQRTKVKKAIPKIKFGNKRDLIHGVSWHHFDTSKVLFDSIPIIFSNLIELVEVTVLG